MGQPFFVLIYDLMNTKNLEPAFIMSYLIIFAGISVFIKQAPEIRISHPLADALTAELVK